MQKGRAYCRADQQQPGQSCTHADDAGSRCPRFTESDGGGKTETRRFAVFFDGDALTRWEGDYFPEQNLALWREMQRFGNLPKSRDEKKKRAR